MNLRLTILLVLVLALFGGAFLVFRFTDISFLGGEEAPPEEPWLYRIDEGTLVYVSVETGGQRVEFQREPGGITWYIQGDPAQERPDIPVWFGRWGGIPLLLSGPRVNRSLAETLGDGAAYGLAPPETVVQVEDWAGNRFEFHMGRPTPDGGNQYARLVGSEALFTVPAVWAGVVNRLALEPPWGRLFEIEHPDRITVVEISAGDETTIYQRGDDGLSWLVPGDPPLAVGGEWETLLARLSAPYIDRIDAYDIDDPAEYGLEPPQLRVVIAQRGAAPVEFHLGGETPDGEHRYARTISENDPYLYAIRHPRLAGLDALATDPPLAAETPPADGGDGG